MIGAGVEQRGRAGDVFQRGEQAIKLERFADLVAAQRAGDAHEEMLRGLDHQALLRMAQQVAVVHRAQAEVLEAARGQRIDRIVELARVQRHKVAQAFIEDAEFGTAHDRLREALDFLAAHFLVDIGTQQARSELAVLGLLGGQCGGGADRQLVEFLRGSAVVQAADGLQCHAQRIDAMQAFGAAGDRAHDLVDVDDLLAAVALRHAHLARVVRRGKRERFAGGSSCCGFDGGRLRGRRVIDGNVESIDAYGSALADSVFERLHGGDSGHEKSNTRSRAQGLKQRIPWTVAKGTPRGVFPSTYLPTEVVTTHRGTFAPMCRQVFGLADVDLAIRLLAPASQP